MNECSIVRDLLPLYVDDLVSPESGDFIGRHMEECPDCRRIYERMEYPVPSREEPVNFRKGLRREIWKIVGKTVLTLGLILGLFLYGLWEWGFLNRKMYTSPDGETYFEVLDTDSGFFKGGAYIVTPDGRGRNLYGDKSYRDFHVWFAPNSSAYFVWIEFDDHDETYLMTTVQHETDGYAVNQYYPSFEISQRDFIGELKKDERLSGTDAKIMFSSWSGDSRYLYFDYETTDGKFGEICFDCQMLRIVNVT